MTEYIIIITTVGKQTEAQIIARRLVTQRLAACVNILPRIHSIYWWEGAICEEEEIMIVIKTKSTCEDQVYQLIKSLHSYDLPELITLTIANGDEPYLNWLNVSLSTS